MGVQRAAAHDGMGQVSYGRDRDGHTRGVGAIAAADRNPSRRVAARRRAAVLGRRDRAMVALGLDNLAVNGGLTYTRPISIVTGFPRPTTTTTTITPIKGIYSGEVKVESPTTRPPGTTVISDPYRPPSTTPTSPPKEVPVTAPAPPTTPPWASPLPPPRHAPSAGGGGSGSGGGIISGGGTPSGGSSGSSGGVMVTYDDEERLVARPHALILSTKTKVVIAGAAAVGLFLLFRR